MSMQKPVAELKVLRFLTVLMLILVIVPLFWTLWNREQVGKADAERDHGKIRSDIESGQLDRAWVTARLFLANPHASSSMLRQVGEEFLEADRPDEAYLLLESSYFRERDASVLMLMAKASYERSDYFVAESLVKRALDAGAGGREGILLAGRIHTAEGRFAEAVSDFNSILDRNPNDLDAIWGKAVAFQAIDRHAQAYELWTRYLLIGEKGGADVESMRYAEVQSIRSLEGIGSMEQAGSEWESLLSKAESTGDAETRVAALEGLGNFHFMQGDYAAAEALYRRLVQLGTGEEHTNHGLKVVLCLHLRNKDDEAVVYLAERIEDDPATGVVLFEDDRFEALRGLLTTAAAR